MKEIGIIVCNYNKAQYVVKCVESILNSSFKDVDIVVVDNASTDDSIEQLHIFQNRIQVIQNKENIGGSGGFNTGLSLLLKREYKYIMLIDNDVVLEQEAIEALYNFMEREKEVGLAGAKIMKMDQPDYLQEMGAMIDYNCLGVTPFFAGEKDREDIPDIVYCDYVPACALIARVEAIKKLALCQKVISFTGMIWNGDIILMKLDIKWHLMVRQKCGIKVELLFQLIRFKYIIGIEIK